MNELLGQRIETLRTEKGFTLEQMANSICMSSKQYARIESGATSITFERLLAIANVLDISIGDITQSIDDEYDSHISNSQNSSSKIFDMLDLFYSNKHMYAKLCNR